jgi:putative DNA primase/helicase
MTPLTTATAALDELAAYAQWVCWKWTERDGKKTKPPYDAKTGGLASSTDPATWATYAEAIATGSRFDGVGFVVTDLDPYVGVDLDHCVSDEGRIAPWAAAIVAALNSYTEITPSGHGLRTFVRGKLPAGGRKRGHLEIYDSGRYFTITARRLPGTPDTIEDRQAELDALLAEHFVERPPAAPPTNGHHAPVDLDDAALLDHARRAKHGDRFRALYDAGDWKCMGYTSRSEADLALSHDLIFWTDGDVGRADRLFRGSALMRAKWDERHGRATYGALTLETAAAGRTEGYSGAIRAHRPVVVVEAACCRSLPSRLERRPSAWWPRRDSSGSTSPSPNVAPMRPRVRTSSPRSGFCPCSPARGCASSWRIAATACGW